MPQVPLPGSFSLRARYGKVFFDSGTDRRWVIHIGSLFEFRSPNKSLLRRQLASRYVLVEQPIQLSAPHNNFFSPRGPQGRSIAYHRH